MEDEVTRAIVTKKFRIERLRAYVLIAATLVMFALLVGCGPPPDIKVPGTASGKEAEVYPGASDESTQYMKSDWRVPGLEQYRTVSFRTEDAPGDILSYYRGLLLSKGWAISGCQNGVGSLTVVWVHDNSKAMEVVEVVTGAPGQRNVELRFARHEYADRSSASMDRELAKGTEIYECLGVANARSDAREFAAVFANVVVALVMLLHIGMSAMAWQGKTVVSVFGLIAVGTVTTIIWLVLMAGTEIASLFMVNQFVDYSQLRDYSRSEELYMLAIQFPYLYAFLLAGITWTGIMLKTPLEDARRAWRMRRAAGKKPRKVI